LSINGTWDESDEGPNAAKDNPIRDYLENVMKVVVCKYSQPFPWGQFNVKLSVWEMFDIGFSRLLWF